MDLRWLSLMWVTMNNTRAKVQSLAALYERMVGGADASLRMIQLTLKSVRADDPELADVMEYCALPRRFDATIIGVLLAAERQVARLAKLELGVASAACRVRDDTRVKGDRDPWVIADPNDLLESERGWWVRVGDE